jgi:hypothetical protein
MGIAWIVANSRAASSGVDCQSFLPRCADQYGTEGHVRRAILCPDSAAAQLGLRNMRGIDAIADD